VTTTRDQSAIDVTTKPVAIYVDATGERLGELTSWDLAHQLAHDLARNRPDLAPLAVEDRRQRTTRFVHPDRCELVIWSAFSKLPVCDLPPNTRRDPAEHLPGLPRHPPDPR
jgi:hypothetical protein